MILLHRVISILLFKLCHGADWNSVVLYQYVVYDGSQQQLWWIFQRKVDALAAEIGTTSDNDKVVSLTRELEQQVLDDMPLHLWQISS